MRGIDYIAKYDKGVFAICIAGGYTDDHDTGDFISYTGEGGQGSDRSQIRDQTLTKGNLGLQRNFETGTPVRVIRGVREGAREEKVAYVYEGAPVSGSGFRIRVLFPCHVL